MKGFLMGVVGVVVLILVGVIIYYSLKPANVPIHATSITYWWIPPTPWNPWPHRWRPWRPNPPPPGPPGPPGPPPPRPPLGPGGEQHLLGPGGEKRLFGGSAPEAFRVA